jgi:hypothetical protein
MTASLAVETSASEIIERMAVASPLSWDEKTRTFECFISSDNDIGDGVALSHDQGAFRFPPRPVPLTIDHSNKSEDVWGALSELRIERINGKPVLVGHGKVDDGETPAIALALARLRNGSARFSVRAKIYRIAPPMDRNSARVALDWEMLETSLVLSGKDPVSIMRASDNLDLEVPPMTVPATSPDPAPVAAAATPPAAAAPAAVVERSAAPAGALVFTCNGRGSRLFDAPHHDAACLQESLGPVPAAGFFAQGEFGPIGRRNCLHGFTASIALFE